MKFRVDVELVGGPLHLVTLELEAEQLEALLGLWRLPGGWYALDSAATTAGATQLGKPTGVILKWHEVED